MPGLEWNVPLYAKAGRGNSTSTNDLTNDGVSVTKSDWQGYCHHVGTTKFAYDKTDGIAYCVTNRIIMWNASKEVSHRDKDVSVRSGRDKKSYYSDSELAYLLD